ncbi:MAG TPA: hypothetical protein DCM27_08135, partial [Rhodospirillaceae bacterium]|nr:hypothetical protein [Rhodospirillaceae bacterium]
NHFSIEFFGFHGWYVGSAGYDLSANSSNFNARVAATNNVSKSIEAVGNGWYRCSLTATLDSSASPTSVPRINFLFSNAATYNNYTGDGASGIYIWGAQLEAGAFATSYIPTTTAAVTRVADNLFMPVGSWYAASQGTLLARALNGVNDSVVGIAALEKSGSVGADRLTLIRASTLQIEAMSRVGNTNQFQTAISGNGHNSSNLTAFAYQPNNFRQSLNGTLSSLGTSGNVPTVDTFRLGAWNGGDRYYDGWLQTIKYYPLRVRDTQLQLLTQ